ncbi:cilia- and flagella-associated protein 20 isoform X2 [Selaginella moellendorffii]|uniref:cilia- and flagella-associated protein 20 isoform X2 n=1 Tax=Selaginella moellendorffii TaxID=88036 RepID=UPI000D1CAAA0|nr:cilia- and flagella-associated protein 20 isoform X2 [Selaginella moellendorffii]XP_024543654.1 cilia- and flagella-associated protein 20 isoform X2 [Selaginella moellendorffii]|eukprot:XP_024520452.1 cilia- and flagella-associated protein 20 isoform X2 [Selaginella moellendorffii]
MFKNTPQYAFLTLLYSDWLKPLYIWRHEVENGHIKRVVDEDCELNTIEIIGQNVKKNSITCPSDPKLSLGIKHHHLVMIVKNLGTYFGFEVLILDSVNEMRYLRVSNFESNSRVRPLICSTPVRLQPGWNQIEFNLADYTRRAYGTKYVEALRVQVHANCRIRRIYFSSQLYPNEELPAEFKLVKQKKKIDPLTVDEPQPGDILRARPNLQKKRVTTLELKNCTRISDVDGTRV